MAKTSLLALGIFALYLLFDFVWFQISGNFFKGEIETIARLNAAGNWDVKVGAALLVYVFMTLGMVTLVLHHSESLGEIMLYGALFGAVVYGVYDFTNMATLSAWTYNFVLVDIVWGIIMNMVVALGGRYYIKILAYF